MLTVQNASSWQASCVQLTRSVYLLTRCRNCSIYRKQFVKSNHRLPLPPASHRNSIQLLPTCFEIHPPTLISAKIETNAQSRPSSTQKSARKEGSEAFPSIDFAAERDCARPGSSLSCPQHDSRLDDVNRRRNHRSKRAGQPSTQRSDSSSIEHLRCVRLSPRLCSVDSRDPIT